MEGIHEAVVPEQMHQYQGIVLLIHRDCDATKNRRTGLNLGKYPQRQGLPSEVEAALPYNQKLSARHQEESRFRLGIVARIVPDTLVGYLQFPRCDCDLVFEMYKSAHLYDFGAPLLFARRRVSKYVKSNLHQKSGVDSRNHLCADSDCTIEVHHQSVMNLVNNILPIKRTAYTSVVRNIQSKCECCSCREGLY